jgi:hypothetical protein
MHCCGVIHELSVSGEIPPSRVRTLHSLPVTVLPELDGAAEPLNPVLGVGHWLVPLRMYVWKPAGSAYVGISGGFQLRDAIGAVVQTDPGFSAALQSPGAYSAVWIAFTSGVAYPGTPDFTRYELFFPTADVTGDGPPLFYTIIYNRVPASAPFA